jgi:hypothetical protein
MYKSLNITIKEYDKDCVSNSCRGGTMIRSDWGMIPAVVCVYKSKDFEHPKTDTIEVNYQIKFQSNKNKLLGFYYVFNLSFFRSYILKAFLKECKQDQNYNQSYVNNILDYRFWLNTVEYAYKSDGLSIDLYLQPNSYSVMFIDWLVENQLAIIENSHSDCRAIHKNGFLADKNKPYFFPTTPEGHDLLFRNIKLRKNRTLDVSTDVKLKYLVNNTRNKNPSRKLEKFSKIANSWNNWYIPNTLAEYETTTYGSCDISYDQQLPAPTIPTQLLKLRYLHTRTYQELRSLMVDLVFPIMIEASSHNIRKILGERADKLTINDLRDVTDKTQIILFSRSPHVDYQAKGYPVENPPASLLSLSKLCRLPVKPKMIILNERLVECSKLKHIIDNFERVVYHSEMTGTIYGLDSKALIRLRKEPTFFGYLHVDKMSEVSELPGVFGPCGLLYISRSDSENIPWDFAPEDQISMWSDKYEPIETSN